jgi:hypothetical protein
VCFLSLVVSLPAKRQATATLSDAQGGNAGQLFNDADKPRQSAYVESCNGARRWGRDYNRTSCNGWHCDPHLALCDAFVELRGRSRRDSSRLNTVADRAENAAMSRDLLNP